MIDKTIFKFGLELGGDVNDTDIYFTLSPFEIYKNITVKCEKLNLRGAGMIYERPN